VATLLKFAHLGPLVLSDVVDFTLAACIVGVLRANRIDVVLGLKIVAAVEVRQLVAALAVLHGSAALNLIRLLVENETVVGDDGANLVFLEFSADEEDLVLRLNAGEALGHQVCVADGNGRSVLGGQLVDQHHFELLVEVVETWLLRLEDKVRLEGKYIVQEPSEFIDLTAHLDHWPCIIRHEFIVLLQSCLELLSFGVVVGEESLLLENVEELAGLGGHLFVLCDQFFNFLFHCRKH